MDEEKEKPEESPEKKTKPWVENLQGFLALIVIVAAYVLISLLFWNSNDTSHWHGFRFIPFGKEEHDYYLSQEKLPTCEEAGIRVYRCSICGHGIEEKLDPTGHFPNDGVITKEPGCLEPGEKEYACTVCGAALETEVVPPKGHSYVVTIIQAPDCESRGLIEKKCSVCGDSSMETVDAKGHDWIFSGSVSPSCTSDGYDQYTCSVCGTNRREIIPAIGHEWLEDETEQPTCVSRGSKRYICANPNCGETKEELIPATGHVYFDGVCQTCGLDRNRYNVGGIGPAGGIVFYDCDADNDNGNADGLISSECGWRFLESAPADLRVVDGVPTVDAAVAGYSEAPEGYIFGYYRTEDEGDNLYVNGTTSNKNNDITGTETGTGKENTMLVLSAMGDESYCQKSGPDKTSNYAARLCAILNVSVKEVKYGDWYLPSMDELDLMFAVLKENGLGDFSASYYWSSSEYGSKGFNNACAQNFDNGEQVILKRGDFNPDEELQPCVRPIRSF